MFPMNKRISCNTKPTYCICQTPVCCCKPPVSKQNNKVLEVRLTSNAPGNNLDQLVLTINSTYGFTVPEDVNLIFTLKLLEEDRKVQFLFNPGKGTYGYLTNRNVFGSDFTELLGSVVTGELSNDNNNNMVLDVIPGVGSSAPIITNNTLQSLNNNITSTVNGVVSSTSTINSNVINYSGTTLTSTVNGVVSTTTIDIEEINKFNLASGNTNVLSVTGGTDAVLSASTINIVPSNINNQVLTTVSGVPQWSTTTNEFSLSGTILTSTVNGVVANQDLSSVSTSNSNVVQFLDFQIFKYNGNIDNNTLEIGDFVSGFLSMSTFLPYAQYLGGDPTDIDSYDADPIIIS